MPSSYPTSAKAFTTKSDGPGNTILAAHINDLQAEVTAVETDLIAGLPAARGGTGLTSYTIGDIPYASASGTLAKLADVATGQVLVSGGVGAAPAYSASPTVTNLVATGDIYNVAWTDYAGTSTITGWSSFTSNRKLIYYKKIGKTVLVSFLLEGTSNATSISFTLPYTAVTDAGNLMEYGGALTYSIDNGSLLTVASRVSIGANSATVNCYSNMGIGAWTGSGTKSVRGSFWFETA